MSQNGQTHFKNLAAFAARFLKCVQPFWDIMHERVNFAFSIDYSIQLKGMFVILCIISIVARWSDQMNVNYILSIILFFHINSICKNKSILLVQVHRLLESFCPMVDHESYVS